MVGGSELKVLPSGVCPSILMVSPIKATLPKVEREVSMTMEVRDLLSQVVLYTSGHVSGNTTPKTLNPVVIPLPLPHKWGDLSCPVDTSSQVRIPDDAEMGEASLGEIPAAPSPTAKTPGPSSSAPPTDVGHLQEEANEALGELLATKSTFDACQWKLVWELGLALWQNSRIHKGSQGHLQNNHQESLGHLQNNHQGSQGHLHPFHMGG